MDTKYRKSSAMHEKSYTFALRMVKLTAYLRERNEYVLSKQVLRSGTAIGALVREAEFAQSNADFTNKLSVALKEANETVYWLSLLKDSGYIDSNAFESIDGDCGELIALLISSIKTIKKRMNDEKRA